jgi:hypothetical protein
LYEFKTIQQNIETILDLDDNNKDQLDQLIQLFWYENGWDHTFPGYQYTTNKDLINKIQNIDSFEEKWKSVFYLVEKPETNQIINIILPTVVLDIIFDITRSKAPKIAEKLWDVKPDIKDVKPDIKDVKPDIKDVKPDINYYDFSDSDSEDSTNSYNIDVSDFEDDNTFNDFEDDRSKTFFKYIKETVEDNQKYILNNIIWLFRVQNQVTKEIKTKQVDFTQLLDVRDLTSINEIQLYSKWEFMDKSKQEEQIKRQLSQLMLQLYNI